MTNWSGICPSRRITGLLCSWREICSGFTWPPAGSRPPSLRQRRCNTFDGGWEKQESESLNSFQASLFRPSAKRDGVRSSGRIFLHELFIRLCQHAHTSPWDVSRLLMATPLKICEWTDSRTPLLPCQPLSLFSLLRFLPRPVPFLCSNGERRGTIYATV